MNKQSKTRKRAKIKIGFVFDDSLDSSDGVAQYVKTLGEWMNKQDHEVRYLVGQTKLKSFKGGTVYSLSRNLPVVFNQNRMTIPLPAKKQPITKIIEAENFDVLHVQVPYSPFMAKHVIDQAGDKTAVIGTFHILPAGISSALGTRSLKPLLGKSLKRFDKIVSVSQAASEFAKKVFDIETDVLPNTVNVAKFNTRKNNKKDIIKIVFLGRLVKRKGAYELLKAFESVIKIYPHARLVIAGDGPERNRLERFVNKQGMVKVVDFLGFINESAKPDILANADIACFPSTGGESFGIVLLEAMASGAGVVIGGDNPGYKSVLGKYPQLLFDPKDTDMFAKTLLNFISDESRREAMHKWQAEHIKRYDVNIVGQELIDIYQEAIAKRSILKA